MRRQPTVSEAVWLITNSLTREYRRSCLAFYKLHYGETFALAVEKETRKKWKGKHDAVA